MQLRSGRIVETIIEMRVSDTPSRQKRDMNAIIDLIESARSSKDRILFVGRLYRYLNDVFEIYGEQSSILSNRLLVNAAVQKGDEMMRAYPFMKPRHQLYFERVAKHYIESFIELGRA